MERRCYSFGRFRIDTGSRMLLHEDERVGIPPKTAEVLLALLESGVELIAREELMKVVWPDTFVEDNNLAKHIFLLRKRWAKTSKRYHSSKQFRNAGIGLLGKSTAMGPVALASLHMRSMLVSEL
jgi:DNA-binding winged helix-turn-helix (wHTH) protein